MHRWGIIGALLNCGLGQDALFVRNPWGSVTTWPARRPAVVSGRQRQDSLRPTPSADENFCVGLLPWMRKRHDHDVRIKLESVSHSDNTEVCTSEGTERTTHREIIIIKKELATFLSSSCCIFASDMRWIILLRIELLQFESFLSVIKVKSFTAMYLQELPTCKPFLPPLIFFKRQSFRTTLLAGTPSRD